jgi:hypothetical protein
MMEDDDEMITHSPEAEDEEKGSKSASPHIARSYSAQSALQVNINANYSAGPSTPAYIPFADCSASSPVSSGHSKTENMDHIAKTIAQFGSTTPPTLSPSASFIPPHGSSNVNLHIVSLLSPELFFSLSPPLEVGEDKAFLAKLNLDGERNDTQRREKCFLPVICSTNPFTLPSTYQDMLEERKLRAVRNRRMLDESELSPTQRQLVQQRIQGKFQHWLEESFPPYLISNMVRAANIAESGKVAK